MTAAGPAVNVMENPYVGPRPFEREDEDKLFGRDEETRELLAVITATPITLLYAQSGAGKTSLLKAKLLPLLERRPCEVYGPLRVASPERPESGAKNAFTYNALLSLCGTNTKIPQDLASMTLAAFLDRQPKPEWQRGSIRMPRVLIFDQFEDLFTRYPERWEDRGKFFDDVREAVAADPRLRIVFAMREEYLATFEAYAADLPPANMTRFRLERLRRSAAEEAIKNPLLATGVTIRQETVDKLLDDLMALPETAGWPIKHEEFAEAVQLQIVCFSLWEATKERRTNAAALNQPAEIDIDDVRCHGDVEQALRDYYAKSIGEIVARFGEKYDFHVGKLRTWFERTFINEEGQRSMVFKGATTTAGFPNEVLDALQGEKYLIRNEPRGTTTWCELSHERFIKPILESNRIWRSEADAGNRVRSLENSALQWRDAGRLNDLLLGGSELRRAESLLKGEGSEIGTSRTLDEYLQASAAQRQQRSTSRLRLILALSIVGILLVVGLAVQANRTLRAINSRALASVAQKMLGEQRPLDAMPWAVKAVIQDSGQTEAVKQLRQTLEMTSPSAAWLQRPNAPIVRGSFSPDGKLVLTQSPAEVCLWNLTGGGPPNCRPAPAPDYWSDAQMTPDSGFVIAKSALNEFESHPRVWRTDGATISKDLTLPSNPWLVEGCGKKNVLVVGSDDRLSVYDTQTGKELYHQSQVSGEFGAVSANCGWLVTISPSSIAEPKATLWSATLQERRQLPIEDAGFPIKPSFDDAGQYVLLAPADSIVRASVYEAEKGNRLFFPPSYPPAAKTVMVGRWFVVERQAGGRNVLDYYDLRTGKPEEQITDLAGDYVQRSAGVNATVVKRSGGNSIVEVLNLGSRRRSPPAEIPDSGFKDFTVSPDARSLMTLKNGVVRIWSLGVVPAKVEGLSPEQLITRACQQLKRFGNGGDVREECGKQ